MITKNSIILAEPLVLETQKDLTAAVKNSIVGGLMEVSYGAFPYGDNYRQEIVETTEESTHTEIMEQASSLLAEKVREVFADIKTYGIGFGKVVSDELRQIENSYRLVDIVTQNLNIKFVNLDNPFLISPVYPQGPKNTQFAFNAIDLSAGTRLKFDMDAVYADGEDYVNSTHPDIIAALADPDGGGVVGALSSILDIDGLRDVISIQGNVADFTVMKTWNMAKLFKMFILASKMYSTEDPIKYLREGTLTDYREYVNMVWNGLCVQLVRIKTMVDVYRAQGIAMRKVKQPRIAVQSRRFNSSNRTLNMSTLEGDVVVFYTDNAMNTLVSNEYCLRDWALGVVYAELHNIPVSGAELLAGGRLKGLLYELFEKTRADYDGFRREDIHCMFESAVTKFVASRKELDIDIKELLKQLEDDARWGFVIANMMTEATEGADWVDLIMSSGAVQSFLRRAGFKDAAAILDATKHTHDLDVVEKRKRLHYGLTKVLVDRIIG